MEINDLKQEIGQRVRECRLQAGFTQAQCAEVMDISVNFLSEIETGKKGMSQETIYKFCKQLQISADYLLFGAQKKELPYDLVQLINSLSEKELSALAEYITALQKLQEFQEIKKIQ